MIYSRCLVGEKNNQLITQPLLYLHPFELAVEVSEEVVGVLGVVDAYGHVPRVVELHLFPSTMSSLFLLWCLYVGVHMIIGATRYEKK